MWGGIVYCVVHVSVRIMAMGGSGDSNGYDADRALPSALYRSD